MKKTFLAALAIAAFAMTSIASADTVTITALDLRGTGLFGHDFDAMNPDDPYADLVSGPGNVTADPVDWVITYNNLDIDGDGTANDSVDFTVRASGGGAAQRAWGQGVDTGFGNLNDVTVSVINVSGTTTDSGNAIVFDGFSGAAAAMGSGSAFVRNVDVNGTTVNLSTPGGGWNFTTEAIDFALTPTVLYDNSGGTGGSIVARNYDLQFSSVPEPSTLALLGAVAGLMTLRRRR